MDAVNVGLDSDLDLDLDLSWIHKEELKLERSQNVFLKPLQNISVIPIYIKDDSIIFCGEKSFEEMAVSDSHSSLSSDHIIRLIQKYKTGCGDNHKWTWAHGAVFHIDVDINNVYNFSAILNGSDHYLKPLNVYRDLVLIENPNIFHSYSQIFLFFNETANQVSGILKSGGGEEKMKSTKKVRIHLPSKENNIIKTSSSSSSLVKRRKTLRREK